MEEEAGHLDDDDDNDDDDDKDNDDNVEEEKEIADSSPDARAALAPRRLCAVVFKHVVPNCQAH